jgi:hypothetical protein
MATFDAKKLSQLDWGVAGAGALALISLFLPWYGFSSAFGSFSVSGWSTSYGWLGGLLIVAAGIYLVLQRSEVNLSGMPAGPAVVVLGAASLGTLIVILRWLTLPSGHSGALSGVAGFSYSYGPRLGIIITLIVGIVQVVCAFMMFRTSGEAVPWAKQVAGPAYSTPTSGSAFPPAGSTVPPADSTPPPAGSTFPPADASPPAGSTFPPAETPPPADSSPPPTA